MKPQKPLFFSFFPWRFPLRNSVGILKAFTKKNMLQRVMMLEPVSWKAVCQKTYFDNGSREAINDNLPTNKLVPSLWCFCFVARRCSPTCVLAPVKPMPSLWGRFQELPPPSTKIIGLNMLKLLICIDTSTNAWKYFFGTPLLSFIASFTNYDQVLQCVLSPVLVLVHLDS